MEKWYLHNPSHLILIQSFHIVWVLYMWVSHVRLTQCEKRIVWELDGGRKSNYPFKWGTWPAWWSHVDNLGICVSRSVCFFPCDCGATLTPALACPAPALDSLSLNGNRKQLSHSHFPKVSITKQPPGSFRSKQWVRERSLKTKKDVYVKAKAYCRNVYGGDRPTTYKEGQDKCLCLGVPVPPHQFALSMAVVQGEGRESSAFSFSSCFPSPLFVSDRLTHRHRTHYLSLSLHHVFSLL
jgi:hypothetical protein